MSNSSSAPSRDGGRHRQKKQFSKIRKGALATGATLAIGATVITPAVSYANPLGGIGGGFDLDSIGDLLTNEMILDYIRVCQTGDEAPEIDESTELLAVADCSQSTGTGIGIVLPESIELGSAAENMTIDLGDDILGFRMGERNLIELVSAAALGSNATKSLVDRLLGVRIDPFELGTYESIKQVQKDAELPVEMVTERYCSGVIVWGGCVGSWRTRTYDKNLEKRTEALKIAEFLTGEKYDYTKPVELPGKIEPHGTSTTIGDGIQVAASMRGGNALGEAHQLFGLPAIALAGADKGRSSIAYSQLGIASALNMDTDEIKLTWFGQELDFTKLRESGATEFLDEDMEDMLDMAENLQLPALKEVSCFGVVARAEAEGLGSCSNILGTFDSYEDLREARPGESRQTQFGLTDITSLVMGNDALVKQLTGEAENTPFLDDLMHNLTSEDDRLKFANDFVRFTKDVATDYVMEPVLDENGDPVIDEETGEPEMKKKPKMVPAMEDGEEVMENVLDEDGNPLMGPELDDDGNEVVDPETGELKMTNVQRPVLVPELDADGHPVYETFTTTAAWLTSDYGLREPVTVEWLGHSVTFFPAVDINGDYRPNLIGAPEIKKIQEDADSGILPKVSLVQWDRAFGRGTITLDDISNPGKIFRDWRETVTTREDLAWIGRQLGMGSADDAVEEETDATEPESSQPPVPATDGTQSSEAGSSAARSASTSAETTEESTSSSGSATSSTTTSSSTTTTTPSAPAAPETSTPVEPAESTTSAPAAPATSPAESAPESTNTSSDEELVGAE